MPRKQKRARANGEGTITQRRDGRWMAQMTYLNKAGQRKRLTFYAATRKEAAARLAEAIAEREKGQLPEPDRTTFGQWLDTWLTEYAKPHIRATTYADYESIIRVHVKPELGDIQLRRLRPEHLQRLYNQKTAVGLSPRRVRLIHVVIHAALKQALKNQLIPRNPAEATTLPRQPKREIRVLTPEEEQRFLAALEKERLGALFLLALWTGLRRGELLGLKWQDVDIKAGVLNVRRSLVRVQLEKGETELRFQEPKTAAGRRTVPLPPGIVAALKVHKARQAQERLQAGPCWQNGGLVFCHKDGRPIDPSWVTKNFHRLLKAAKVKDTNFHALRHTFATRLLELGENPKVTQKMLGHSSIEMTLDTYSHVLPSLERQAAEKLEGLLASMQNAAATAPKKEPPQP
jgi:integrase